MPDRFEVRHQAAPGGRWKVVGTAPDWRGAVALMNGPGSWWFKEIRDAKEVHAAGATLPADRDPMDDAGGLPETI